MALNFYSDSISARLYRWFYGLEEYELSENLCPYARKLILMYILILPYSVLVIPSIIIEYFEKDTVYERNHTFFRLATTFGVAFIGLILLGLITTPYTLLYGDLNGHRWFECFSSFGIVIWFLIIAGGLYFLIKEGVIYLKDTTTDVVEDSVLVSYLKAKHDKICPRINWTRKKDN